MSEFDDGDSQYSHSAVTLATPPDGAVLTIEEARLHLRLTAADSDHDPWINDALLAAALVVEDRTNRALLTQQYSVFFDRFPVAGGAIELPKPTLQSVESVKYIANDGTLTTWDSTNYVVDTDSERGRIFEAYGKSWPVPRIQRNTVVVAMTCGYGDIGDVPQNIKSAIKLLIGHWFNNREAAVGFSVEEVPMAFSSLLSPSVSHRFY